MTSRKATSLKSSSWNRFSSKCLYKKGHVLRRALFEKKGNHYGIVETTGDLRYAKVWLSVLGLENEKEFRRGLKSASGWLRRELSGALNLRYTPELVFEVDHSIEQGAYISGLIEQLDLHAEEE